MCGRFALSNQLSQLSDLIEDKTSDAIEHIAPSWNIAPSNLIPFITNSQRQYGFALKIGSWGLRPSWSSPSNVEPINAQIETVQQKSMFRNLWGHQHCAIPFDGWYEWKSTPIGKQPFYITPKSDESIFFAGLWDTWIDQESNQNYLSSVILTEHSCEQLLEIHRRKPVLISSSDLHEWIINRSLRPYRGDFNVRPVSREVNSVAKNGPHLIKKLTGLRDYL